MIWRVAIIIVAVMMCGCVSVNHAPEPGPSSNMTGNMSIYFFDVGQGDSALLMTANTTVLIDGGETESGDDVVGYLNGLGVKRLDAVVLSHPHEDHAGGLSYVLSRIPCGAFYDTGYSFSTNTYEELLGTVDRKNIRYVVVDAGDTITAGDLAFEVLSPSYDHSADSPNDDSIVLRVEWGKFSAVFPGDAGIAVEKELGNVEECTVLKASHHGSKTANSREFIEKLSPEVSVISVENGNSYGLPSTSVVKTLISSGSVYRTDVDGNIKIETNGEVYTIDAL